MVIVHLTGGLGNQLFQYAAAKSLSLYHQVPLSLDVSSFYRDELPDLEVPRNFELAHFKGVTEKIINPKEIAGIVGKQSTFQKILPRHKRSIYKEPFVHYDPNFFNSKKNVLLKGNWQSEKYFKRYEPVIREILQPKQESIRNAAQTSFLMDQPTVGVHIRRGDYLRKKIIFEWHGVMSKEYYAEGLRILQERIGNFKVLYFTDDPEWVSTELLPVMNGTVVSKEANYTHVDEFYVMSQCQHNIIGNSSFSWWAAWLNKNPEKIVIGPKKWFDKGPKDTQDILPDSWVSI